MFTAKDEEKLAKLKAKKAASIAVAPKKTVPKAKKKAGPSRIRVTLNRHLSHSEFETMREAAYWSGYISRPDAEFGTPKRTITHKFEYNGGGPGLQSGYTMVTYPFRLRLSGNGRLYAESLTHESRPLYHNVETFLESNFVNLHPVAVRTFRELG